MSTEEFDTILNDCLQLLLEGNKNLEECLSLYPEQADKLRELLILAQAINTLQVETDDNARFRIKQRFLAAASSRRHRSRPVIRSGFFRTLFTSSAAALLVLVVIFIGNSASTEALPGDFLYPVKKAGEQVDETLARDVESKASVGIKLTERRNQELIKLENQPGRVTPAFLISIADQTQKTIDLVSQSGEKTEFTERLSDLTSQQEQSLTKLSGNVSPEVQKGIEKAIEIARGGKDTRERDDDRREPDDRDRDDDDDDERDRDDDDERDRDDDDERDRDDDDEDKAGGQVIPPTTQPGTPTRERSDDRKDDREEEGERTGRTPVSGRGPERPQPDRREQEDNKKPTPEPRKTPESGNPRREDEAKKPQPEQKRDNENARPDSGQRRENENDKKPSARPEERRNDSRQPEREEPRNNENEQRNKGEKNGEEKARSGNERQDNEKVRSGSERQDKDTNSRGKSEGR